MEPVAIVGMACRFPGAADLAAYWRLLRDGVDAIREVPPDRWDLREFYDRDGARPGKMTTRWGGFLERVDEFDPSFFGISPREAAYMDPQQRLLLEVSWEALEDAGVVVEQWAGRPAGVFVGISSYDYGALQLSRLDRIADGYGNTGGALSIAANRISYLFDFRGPSVAVDTACSASLAAAHMACQSLWRGESAMALAGGVNVILSPAITIGFSKLKAMAADGRCKTFDARADGYVRGEGAGMVVLKPLSAALRDGDRIHALIRGSAMNQDGRTNGLTAPNGLSQEALVRQALESAGVEPARVGYVEAHGTGTPLGDPIEMNALGAVLAQGRPPGLRCAVGSVKTNIGHLEAAAGVAGLIKATLALEHGEIPPSLHFQEPNPHIPFDALPLEVQRRLAPWPDELRPAVAGVSSFGFGGTNVHMVLEEPPPAPAAAESEGEPGPERPYLVPLSGRSAEALHALARGYGEFLNPRPSSPDEGPASAPALGDLADTAGRRRSHHEHRLALVAHSRGELLEHLEAFLRGEARPGLSAGRAVRGRRRKLVFVFPGQGAQWFGMASGLCEREPAFRAALEHCEQAIRPHVDWSLLEQIHAEASRSRLGAVDVIQPTLWAIQVGLAALWRSWGVQPDAVVGHSMGEVAAAYVAGALGLEDAARVICRRSRLLRRTSGRGAMAAVELSIEQAERALAGYEDRVSIAVSNSPTSTVLSGDPAALEEILASLESQDVFCRRVKVDVASHSPQMDPLRSELLQVLEGVRGRPAAVPLYSTVTGEVGEDLDFDATYWVRNLREPVLFSRAVRRLAEDGHSLFLELSPHPILLAAVQQGLQHLGREATVLASLRREEDEQAVMLGSLGALFTLGRPVNWSALHPAGGRPVRLPSYPWQRERYWAEDRDRSQGGARPRSGPRAAGGAASGHPLLGEHLRSAAQGTHFWEVDLSADLVPYLADHRVQGRVVVPAAVYLEMALAGAREAFGPGAHGLENVTFEKALLLPEEGPSRVQLVLSPAMPGLASFQLFSLPAAPPGGKAAATLHAAGTVRLAGEERSAPAAATASPLEVQTRCLEMTSAAEHYDQLREGGLEYGPRFQGVQKVWRRDGEAIARLCTSDELHLDAGSYEVHPALLDACFQVLAAALPRGAARGRAGPYLSVGLGRLRIEDRLPPGARLWGCARLRGPSPAGVDTLQGDVSLEDESGRVVLTAHGLRLKCLDPTGERLASRSSDEWFHEVRWPASPRARPAGSPVRRSAPAPGSWLVFSDRQGVGEALRSLLEARGDSCVLVSHGQGYRVAGRLRELKANRPEDYRRLLRDVFEDGLPSCRGVVHLWSLDSAPPGETTPSTLDAARELGCLSVLHLLRALARAAWKQPPRLWLVTSGAQPAGPAAGPVAIGQAPLWGLGRTIAHEHPELRCTNVDLSGGRPEEAAALLEEISADDREEQVALRGDGRHVARLARVEAGAAPTGTWVGDERPFDLEKDHNFRLEIPTPGVLDNLTLRPVPRQRPGPGQVEIRVRAAGLNFLDVLGAMGLRPDTVDGPLELGAECAGEITALGEGVEGLAIGDEVMAVAPAGLSAFVTTAASLVVRKPAPLSFEEAATIPIAFLTADYALRHLGRLARGERVLIHSAAGGVGLAAVQLAQRIGAEVLATAGTAEKRELLKSLGVRHVMDSRSLEFAEEVPRLTGGTGLDVVLNSLSGEAIPRSLSLLGAYGRFLEIGKRDIHEDRSLGLRPFQNNLSFFAVDLGRVIRERPRLVGSLLGRLGRRFERGTLRPLPIRVFPISEAASAFRLMAQARHIGKVAVSLADQDVRVAPAPERPAALPSEATYLVTGGLGGLALEVARWMVASEGARHVVLVGRRAPSGKTRAVLEAMEKDGARVVVARADVADARQLARVLSEIDQTMPPLKGIVHAGLPDDGIPLPLDLARLAAVLSRKVRGAWNLHAQTLGKPLDFFILFSSAASVLGSPGQGSGAAAHAFLDALAHHRRSQGLPALSINWGPWSEVGLTTRRGRGGHSAFQGMETLSPAEGLAALARLRRGSGIQVSVMPVHGKAWRQLSRALADPPLLADLARERPDHSPETARRAPALTRATVLATAPGERQQFLEGHLREQVARALGLAVTRLDVNRPLSTLGIDSLMAVELKNRIESDLQVSVPLIQVVQGPSVAELATLLLGLLPGGDTVPTEGPGRPEPAPRAKGDSLLLSLLSLAQDERNA